MGKETLKQEAEKLFSSTAHVVLFGVASCNELFTSENAAQNACKAAEKPLKFEKKEKGIVGGVLDEIKEKVTMIRAAKFLKDLEFFKDDESKIIQKELAKKTAELTKPQ